MTISALADPSVSRTATTSNASSASGTRPNQGAANFNLPDMAEPAIANQTGGFKLSGTFQPISALPVSMEPPQQVLDFQGIAAYHEAEANYMLQVMDLVKTKLGLTGDKGDVALSLSGDMIDLAKRAAAAAGILPPAKPDSVVKMEEQNNASSPSPSNAASKTSMLTIYYSAKDGGGSVEMWLDNDQIDALRSQPGQPQLTDLNKNDGDAHALLQSMLDGPFGSFMNEHAAVRPDWAREMPGRLAVGNPRDPKAGPMVMLQSLERPDLLAGNGGSELLGGLMDLLRAA